MPRFNELLWNYFEPNEHKIASCKLCDNKYSYRTTSHNLVHHLKLKHVDTYNEYIKINPINVNRKRAIPMANAFLWEYFTPSPDKIADCKLCNRKLSYKTTSANLKKHLVKRHSDTYQEFHEKDDSVAADSSNGDKSSDSDDAEELSKITDVWRYFETDSSNKAQCVVCKNSVVKEYENLKAHLKESHPDLLLGLLQDQTSDAGSNNGNEDNDNTYTEIVYLEREPSTETVTKRKEKPKPYLKPLKKRERQESVNSFENVPVKKAKNEEEDDELTTFIKYITCLLKKLPSDVFTNVQIEIINAILKANNQANAANTSQSIALNKELVNTSSNIITVDGITPLSSTVMGHHNYTITVAPPKESDTENS